MKRRYILILAFLAFILSVSYASAANNGTEIIKQELGDLNSTDVEGIGELSLNEQASVESGEDCQSNLSQSDGNNITVVKNNDAVGISSSDVVLTSSGVSNSVDVYKEPTKKQRTFKIAKFKAVLSKYQYKKLFKASSIEDYFFDEGYNNYYYVGDKFRGYGVCSTGLFYHIKVKTNKFVKVKVKRGNKVKYKKTRIYMHFTYGAGQCGIAYKYMIFLSHKYNNPGYDSSKVIGKYAKYFGKCKTSASFSNLKKAKLISQSTAYRRYSV